MHASLKNEFTENKKYPHYANRQFTAIFMPVKINFVDTESNVFLIFAH